MNGDEGNTVADIDSFTLQCARDDAIVLWWHPAVYDVGRSFYFCFC